MHHSETMLYDQQQEILSELRKMNKLMLLLATKGESQEDRIIHLDEMGFEQLEIAHMLTETPTTVRRILTEHFQRLREQ